MSIQHLESDAHRMYATLLEGGVVLAQTLTGYGLVAMKPDAVRRIYELKGRPSEKPCVTVGSLPVLDDVALGIDACTRRWLAGAVSRWPMALVTRLNPRSRLLWSFDSFMLGQCTKAGTVATFYGVGPLIARVAQLARADGKLVVGSSANLAGTGNNYAFEAVPGSIHVGVDLAFDYGPAPYSSGQRLASTILDLTTGGFLRRGACFADIQRSWSGFQAEGRRAPVPLGAHVQ